MVDWKRTFDQQLPLLGHRNWILIVDKAFPEQTAAGVRTINTGQQLDDVLQYVKGCLDTASHVSPIIYQDAELKYMDDALSPGISEVKHKLGRIFTGVDTKSMLHEEVFSRIDEAAKLFSVLVLKTAEVHPYTSVFIELDCAYWNAGKEENLREKMLH